MIDFLGPAVFDVLIEIYGRFVGRPWQRVRARRLARRGKIRCALFSPAPATVLHTRSLDGSAEVWEGRIRLWGAEVWVQGVEFPGEPGPLSDVDDKGRVRPAEGTLTFRPKTTIFNLRTHNGTVRWAVLDWQAEEALLMLGFGPQGA